MKQRAKEKKKLFGMLMVYCIPRLSVGLRGCGGHGGGGDPSVSAGAAAGAQ